jgi:transcriptional regulator with XRE-family HTH domain
MAADYKRLAGLLRASRNDRPQAELATRAGVSNKTISEYERGKFGVKGTPDAGVLYRLAEALQVNPLDWFQAAALEYDAEAAAAAIREVNARRPSEGAAIGRSVSHVFQTLDELRTAITPTIRVGIVKSSPKYESFDLRLADLLCSLINPDWKCDITHLGSVDEQLAALSAAHHRCHLVMGIMETLPRTSRGLRFLPYPGIEYRLNVVCSNDHPGMTWTDIQEKIKDIDVIVSRHDVGHEFIVALAGSDAPNIVITRERSIEEFVEVFDHRSKTGDGRPIILCTGEDLCYEFIRRSGDTNRYLLTSTDSTAVRTLPKFRVGCYVRQDDVEWFELLQISISYAMRFATVKLADIYSDLLAQTVPIDNPSTHAYCFGRLCNLSNYQAQEFLNQLSRLTPVKLSKRIFPQSMHAAIVSHAISEASENATAAEDSQVFRRLADIEAKIDLLTIGNRHAAEKAIDRRPVKRAPRHSRLK